MKVHERLKNLRIARVHKSVSESSASDSVQQLSSVGLRGPIDGLCKLRNLCERRTSCAVPPPHAVVQYTSGENHCEFPDNLKIANI